MKKRGATLIEVIAVLGILSLFISIGTIGIKILKDRYEQIEIKSFFYEIMDMLSYGKSYCVSKNVTGIINFANDKDYLGICFVVHNKEVKTLGLQKKLKLKSFDNGEEIKNISLNINSSGYVDPTTINLINENAEVFKITIQVGGNVMIVKEGEN